MINNLHRVLNFFLAMIHIAVVFCTPKFLFATEKNNFKVSASLIDPIAYSSHVVKDKVLELGESIKTCPGEYLSLGILLSSEVRIQNINVLVNSLINSNNNFFKQKNIDIRIAKKWYQASIKKVNPEKNKRFLTHELLLHDYYLVKVDETKKVNYLRVNNQGKNRYKEISGGNSKLSKNDIFNDSNYLLPITIDTGEKKLFWLTLSPRRNIPSGLYNIEVVFFSKDSQIKKIPIQIEILPFNLLPPSMDYGLYYRARLSNETHLVPGSDLKSFSQMQIELENIKHHGVSYPTVYEKMDSGRVADVLSIRDKINFPKDKLFTLGVLTSKSQKKKNLRQLLNQVEKYKKLSTVFGYKDLYVYGIDEAQPKDLPLQFLSWQVIHSAKVKIFVALRDGSFRYARDKIDYPIIPGRKFKSKEVDLWESVGKSVYVYSNPQVGIEDAELYRRNYGFLLWLSPYKGTMNYAYQHQFNDIWNDFDHKKYRDHVFAYPTTNGLIDTVQWEGFREGVNDSRYADYLSTIIGKASAEKLIKKWIGTYLTMNQVRKKVIEKIQNNIKKSVNNTK